MGRAVVVSESLLLIHWSRGGNPALRGANSMQCPIDQSELRLAERLGVDDSTITGATYRGGAVDGSAISFHSVTEGI